MSLGGRTPWGNREKARVWRGGVVAGPRSARLQGPGQRTHSACETFYDPPNQRPRLPLISSTAFFCIPQSILHLSNITALLQGQRWGSPHRFWGRQKGDKKTSEGVWRVSEGSQTGRWKNVTAAGDPGIKKGLSKKTTSEMRKEVWGPPKRM